MCKKRISKLCVYTVLLYLSGCKNISSKQNVPESAHYLKNVLQKDLSENRLLLQNNNEISLTLDKALRPHVIDRKINLENIRNAEKRFNVAADQVDVRAFFLGLVSDTPYNIVLHPNVSGKISLQLNNVSVKEVLETVRNIYGYDYRQNNNNIELLPATLQSRTFTVSYLDLERGGQSETRVSSGGIDNSSGGDSNNSNSGSGSSGSSGSSGNNSGSSETTNSRIVTTSKTDYWTELKKAVETMIGEGGGRKVAVSPLAGVIVVSAMPDELYQVEKFLNSSQKSLNRQVILEAKILEVTLNEDHQAGINWALLGSNNRIAASNLGSGISDQDALSTNLPTSSIDNGLILGPGAQLQRAANIAVNTFGSTFGLALNFKNFSTFIELLKSQGNVQVLSSPRVSTTNNQKALIKVGKDEFYVTNVSSTNVTGGTTTSSSPNVSFQSFFSGIALDVTPHISAEGDVTLHIHPSITTVVQKDVEVDLASSNGVQKQTFPLAASNIRESDSIVRAKNGQVVVIGGLMQDQVGELVVGLPVLKDLPIFGAIFRQTRKTLKKSELIILLRPHIVSDDQWNKTLENEIEIFDSIQRKNR